MNISENIQEGFTRSATENRKPRALLLGGAGFLGQGLARELARRCFPFKVIDRDDMDLADASCIPGLAEIIRGFDCIFLLASQIGVALFQSARALEAGVVNRKIYENVMAALLASGKKTGLFYYSTSEVYWSMPSPDVYIDDLIVPGVGIDYSNPRAVYAAGKLYAERNLADRTRFFAGSDFSAVNIIRPFNVYGPGQRRGVIYSMLKSGMSGGRILYSEDTTRTLTSLSYISEKTVGLIGQSGFRTVNMFDGISTDMKTLALATAKFLAWKYGEKLEIGVEALPPDASIRYRQASEIVRDPDAVFEALRSSGDMNALSEEVASETGER